MTPHGLIRWLHAFQDFQCVTMCSNLSFGFIPSGYLPRYDHYLHGHIVKYLDDWCSTQTITWQYALNSMVLGWRYFIQQQFNGYRVTHFTRFKTTQNNEWQFIKRVTSIGYKIFSVNNKDNTYSDITEYSYSKFFSVGSFLPDAPGFKRRRVMHLGR